MSLTQFGVDTKRTLIHKHESHKLHHEFEVTAAIKRGQPAVLNADGTISPAADTGAAADTVVGYSLHNAAAGELATLVMKPFLVVYAMPKAAVDAGPVVYNGQNTQDTDYPSFTAAAAGSEANRIGFALDQATAANELIRVALL